MKRWKRNPCEQLDNPCYRPVNNYVRIRNAARSCRRCRWLQKCILAVVDGELPSVFRGAQNAAERARILVGVVTSTPSVRYIEGRQDKQEDNLKMCIKGKWLEFELCRDPGHRNFKVRDNEFKESPRFGPTTSSGRTLCNAKRWLRQCEDDHPDCGKQTPGYYPTRLLDLRGLRVQLIETGQTNIEGPYVCLSHRWGNDQHFQSTVRNIENHMEDIPYDTLPKTFQHAVLVCRRLEVDYLWIDSLCILQKFEDISDDELQKTKDDFAKENSSMAKTYRNSHFTICASVSTSMDSGMFSTEECSSCEIEVVDDDGKDAVFHMRGKLSHAETPTVLETRGWTFQEYVLPSRVLGFESLDISWKCRKDLTCECGRINESYNWRQPLGQWAQDLPDPDTAEDWGEEWWAAMVRYYSSRELTHKPDKLPALSGLAQVYNKAFHDHASPDKYLAGIWKASLPSSLCWYYWRSPGPTPWNLGRVSIGHRPEKFRAPSWSWASIDTSDGGECCFWEDDTKEGHHPLGSLGEVRVSCTLYDATCNKATIEDPFGEVLDGFIDLGVKLISASIDRNNNEVADSHTEEGKAWTKDMAWTLSNFQDGWRVYICIAGCSLEDLKKCGLNLGDKVYCAPILETFSDEGGLHIICLVLRRLKGQEYQRIGFCILWAEDEGCFAPDPDGGQVFSHPLQYTQDKEDRIVIV